jgi:hypothetical protein
LCQLKNKCPGFKVVGLTLKMIASPYSVVNILVWVHRTNNLNILTHKKGGSICQKKKKEVPSHLQKALWLRVGRKETGECTKGPTINPNDEDHYLDSCIKYQFI